MILAVQLIGFMALLIDVLSVQLSYRRNILLAQIVASLGWTAHFLLLGATAGAAMNMVGVVRSVTYYKWRQHRHAAKLLWLIIALSLLVTAATWRGPISLLPMTAMIIAATAFWQQSEQKIRLLLLFAAPLWLCYNLLVHSYAGMTNEIIAIISTSIALFRYRKQGFVKATVYPQEVRP